tara:strand:- start:245 stop:604 length:360 start_codon:yes stop_codon:yes gene_type:complete
MPTEIPAVLADLSATVYTLQHKLMQELEVNSRNKRDLQSQIFGLETRITGYHSESYQEYKDDLRKLKKVRSDYKNNMNVRINELKQKIKVLDTQEKKIRQRINTLKVKISKFREQIQNI